jgi:hypothetical protein
LTWPISITEDCCGARDWFGVDVACSDCDHDDLDVMRDVIDAGSVTYVFTVCQNVAEVVELQQEMQTQRTAEDAA